MMKPVPNAEAKRPVVPVYTTPTMVTIPGNTSPETAIPAPAAEIPADTTALDQAVAKASQAALILEDVVGALQEAARRFKELEDG